MPMQATQTHIHTQVQHDYVHSLQVGQAVSVLVYVHTVTWQYVGGVSSCVGGVSP